MIGGRHDDIFGGKRAGLVGWLRMVIEFGRLMNAVKSCLLLYFLFLDV